MQEDTTAALRGCGHDGSIEIDDRTRRALTEPLSVVTTDGVPLEGDESIVRVISHTGADGDYTVDVREGRCSCPDSMYRAPAGACKHVRRSRVVLGRESLDVAVLRELGDDVDDALGANAPGPKVAASDGGSVVAGDSTDTLDEAGNAVAAPDFRDTEGPQEITHAQIDALNYPSVTAGDDEVVCYAVARVNGVIDYNDDALGFATGATVLYMDPAGRVAFERRYYVDKDEWAPIDAVDTAAEDAHPAPTAAMVANFAHVLERYDAVDEVST